MCIRTVSPERGSIGLREDLDIKIAQLTGVEFLISCLTGTENNAENKKGDSIATERKAKGHRLFH